VLRVGVLHQLVLPLLGHARHAEDAQELVHVELVAAHRLHRDGARVQRRAELDETVAHRRRRLHVGERQPPLGQHAKPVDVHGHRGAGAQVGELLPPLLDPVPLGRRSCLENLLKLRADATLLAELSDHGFRVLQLGLGKQRPHRVEVPGARVFERRHREGRQVGLVREYHRFLG